MATVRSKHNASLNTFVSVALHNLTSLPEFTRVRHKFLALPAYQIRQIPHTFRIFEARFLSLPAFPALPEASGNFNTWSKAGLVWWQRVASGGSRIHHRKISRMNFNTSKLLNLLLFTATMASPS